MHTPVLLQEVVEALNIKDGGRYVDATAGEGGHTKDIAKHEGVKVLAIEWDEDQYSRLKITLEESLRNVRFVQGNYADIAEIVKEAGFGKIDGVVFDLGLSMNQIGQSGKGFSYKNMGEPLDMRIYAGNESSAEDIVNTASYEELYDIFSRYGEELDSDVIAKTVIIARKRKPLKKVEDMVNVIYEAFDHCTMKKHSHDFTKTAARIFQALRIQVNDEFTNIKSGLQGAVSILNTGGRIVVISFHSSEDRLVKQFVREHELKFVHDNVTFGDKTRKFERSARMRVFTK